MFLAAVSWTFFWTGDVDPVTLWEVTIMGTRPKWYLAVLAKIWKLLYIKPWVPVIGKLIYHTRVDGTTSEKLNISYLPVNADLEVGSLPLPILIIEGILGTSEHRIITHRCTCRDASPGLWHCPRGKPIAMRFCVKPAVYVPRHVPNRQFIFLWKIWRHKAGGMDA